VPDATMERVAQPNSPLMPFTLSRVPGFLPDEKAVSCLSCSAICGNASRLLCINRCSESISVSLEGVCGGGITGWSTIEVFDASVSTDGPGHTWVKAEGPLPWGPMKPRESGAGKGTPQADPYALSVIVLAR
jgi:hypothetical protein